MFFDTNVLIRARFEAAPGHELARRRMSKAAEGREALRISRQVLREYLAVVTRPQEWSPPVPMDDALEHVGREEENVMELVLFWLMFAIVVGIIANSRNRSGFGWFYSPCSYRQSWL